MRFTLVVTFQDWAPGESTEKRKSQEEQRLGDLADPVLIAFYHFPL